MGDTDIQHKILLKAKLSLIEISNLLWNYYGNKISIVKIKAPRGTVDSKSAES